MAHRFLTLTLVLAALGGCRATRPLRDPEYAAVSRAVHQAVYAPSDFTEQEIAPMSHVMEGPHAVEQYIQVALQQNPKVHAARKKVESLAHQVPVAASLQDPMLNVSVQPEQVQTAAGQQELMISASQQVPWFGKLDMKASVAEAQTNVARAELAAVELETITQVKKAYFELYFIQQAVAIIEAEEQLLGEIRDVANTRYRTGGTSQQDVLRAELEISNTENELITLRQRLASGQARLARLLHLPPQSQLYALETLPDEDLPRSLEQLQVEAVRARPELHMKLAELERDQYAVELANLNYKPDLTFGASWIDVASAGISPVANGRDAFLLSVGGNLPVYRKRLDASVRSAEAKAVSSAREYDALRDGTLEEVTDLFTKAKSQQDMLVLFRDDILPKARQTLQVSSQAYNVGEVDFLQLIDNWRQLLRYEIAHRRLEASLRQTLADLEKTVGGIGESRAFDAQSVSEEPRNELVVPRDEQVLPR